MEPCGSKRWHLKSAASGSNQRHSTLHGINDSCLLLSPPHPSRQSRGYSQKSCCWILEKFERDGSVGLPQPWWCLSPQASSLSVPVISCFYWPSTPHVVECTVYICVNDEPFLHSAADQGFEILSEFPLQPQDRLRHSWFTHPGCPIFRFPLLTLPDLFI